MCNSLKKLLVIGLLLTSFPLFSQTGIKVSSIYSNLESDMMITSSKLGHGIEFVQRYGISDHVNVFYELGYADVGAKILAKKDENTESQFYKLNLISLDASLIGEYVIFDSKFGFQSGICYSMGNIPLVKNEIRDYHFGTREELEDITILSDRNTLDNLREALNFSNDFSFLFGFSTGQEYIRLNIRYYKALSAIKSKNSVADYSLKSNYFQLSGIFYFN